MVSNIYIYTLCILLYQICLLYNISNTLYYTIYVYNTSIPPAQLSIHCIVQARLGIVYLNCLFYQPFSYVRMYVYLSHDDVIHQRLGCAGKRVTSTAVTT